MSGERPVALVTGGARRVGRAICLELARSGCDIVLTYNRHESDALATASAISELGGAARLERADFEDAQAAEALAERLVASRGFRLDVLVHNASVYGPTPLESLPPEEALRHYQVNALAPLMLSGALAGFLRESRLPNGGAIVAMADMHAMGRPRRDFAAYSMSKAALIEMVRTLARDLAPRVRVNAVAPGVVAFPESGYEADAEAQRRYVERVPLGRAGTPEDAAKIVRWLALEAGYITGEVIRLDGGRWLA